MTRTRLLAALIMAPVAIAAILLLSTPWIVALAAVVFLAGDRASAITGVNLPVDCGWLAASGWASYGGLRGPEGSNA